MPDRITVKLDSKALNAQIEKALQRNPRETARAATDCLLELAGRSAQLAPVDTGDLRNDCVATLNGQTIFSQQTPILSMVAPSLKTFGSVGYDLPYALRQHEELGYNHPKGGEAKFLENPFNALEKAFIARMEKVVDDSLK